MAGQSGADDLNAGYAKARGVGDAGHVSTSNRLKKKISPGLVSAWKKCM